jgi:hypothetical protein
MGVKNPPKVGTILIMSQEAAHYNQNSQTATQKMPKAFFASDPGYRAIGLSGYRAIGLSGYRAIGLSGYRAIGLSGYRAIGLSGYRAIIHLS